MMTLSYRLCHQDTVHDLPNQKIYEEEKKVYETAEQNTFYSYP